MNTGPTSNLKSGLFPTGVGIKIAEALEPLIDTLEPAQNQHPLDVLNGIAIILTRRLGALERANEERLPVWVQEYCAFVLSRFGRLN